MCEQTFSQTKNPKTTTNPQLRVYVANLGKYNEGEIVGGWLNLPTTRNEIKKFLNNQVGLNNRYEEYSIQDYESDFRIGEYENIYDLNLLTVVLEQMSDHEKTIAAAYCNANGLKDTTSLLNVCHQINDLSYITLDANAWGSREEKLGYAILDEINTDLKDTLKQCKLGTSLTAYDYFDFEKYGRDITVNDGYFVNDKIFIFYTSDIDPKLYTVEEIKDALNDPRI